MKRNFVKCAHCGREISKSNLTKHERSCSGITNKVSYKLNHDGLVCQFCGKELKNRNSLCNHERMCKQNPNHQISNFVAYNKMIKQNGSTAWNAGLTAKTDERVRKQSQTLKKWHETHESSLTGRKHTDEEKLKIGVGVKDFLVKHPDMVPYLRNHSSVESYPEKYFKELFTLEGLHLVYHYRIHTYELDFCDIDKKIDIEIDGEQHYVDARIIESDKRRNEYLKALGWTIFRIR